MEKDYLEAIVGLPEQLFYNTGITTYVWILTNRKEEKCKDKVQLIDASSFWAQMRKSLGNKRREISQEHIDQITEIHLEFVGAEYSKIFDTTDFGYRKVRIERPLRLNFQANAERINRLKENTTFQNLALSRKKNLEAKAAEQAEGRKVQNQIFAALESMPDTVFKDRPSFEKALNAAIGSAGLTIGAPVKKVILASLSQRDETAEICRDKEGNPEPDPDLRDHEHVPLQENIYEFFEREVRPHVADAWIDESYRDERDGQVGKVGYEINFNRHFYKYQPPRPLQEIEADIKQIEGEILELLREVAG